MTRIESLARVLPPCPLAGFECRLGPGPQRVDFQVQLPHDEFAIPPRFAHDAVWTSVHEFHREFVSGSVAQQSISEVDLEFDMETDDRPPAVFVALKQHASANPDLLINTASMLFRRVPGEQLVTNLRSCINALPDTAAIRFLGAMLSREAGALRVNAVGIRPQQICDYLRAAGWSYSATALQELASRLAGLIDTFVVCLDLTDRILPSVGLECVLKEQPPQEPRWSELLDELERLGLCTSAKKVALLGWHGCTRKAREAGPWPETLSWGDRLLGSAAVSLFYRYLSHLKINYRPDQPFEAKAYLGFSHQWIEATDLADNLPLAARAKSKKAPQRTRSGKLSDPLKQVRRYWEETTRMYVQYGTTFQGGYVVQEGPGEQPRANNLYLASRAGIRSGDSVLDAGCGVCGPSIDIAQNLGPVKIDAVTLCPQASPGPEG